MSNTKEQADTIVFLMFLLLVANIAYEQPLLIPAVLVLEKYAWEWEHQSYNLFVEPSDTGF